MEIEDGERRGADHLRGPAPLKEAQVSLYPWGTAFDHLSPRSPSSGLPGARHTAGTEARRLSCSTLTGQASYLPGGIRQFRAYSEPCHFLAV